MFKYLCFNVWVCVLSCLSICVLMFEYLCLCVHSPFYSLYLCLSSSSVSIEGLIPLMRGLRGLLVVQTFNAHLFARFSFRTHLFGFPFSLAVGHQAPRLYYLPIYSVTVQRISLLFMLYLCSAAKEWIFMGLLLKIWMARGGRLFRFYTFSENFAFPCFPPLYICILHCIVPRYLGTSKHSPTICDTSL